MLKNLVMPGQTLSYVLVAARGSSENSEADFLSDL